MQRSMIAIGLALGLVAAQAQAQQVTIRWGDVVPATHPSVQMIERIAADVKAKTNGRVVIQAFPGGQLGGSRDMIDATANGVQQVVTEGAANFGAWVPTISIVEAPYIWRDAAHLDKVMSGPIGAAVQRAARSRRAACASSARPTTARATSRRPARQ